MLYSIINKGGKSTMKHRFGITFIIMLIIILYSIKINIVHNDLINKYTKNGTTSKTINNLDIKIKKANISNPNLVLANKEHKLSSNYTPKNLTIPNVKFIPNSDPKNNKMEKVASDSLEKLFNAAKNDNVILLAISGYRSYSYQENLYNNKIKTSGKEEADKYVAHPGASEHQTGLAMDIDSNAPKTLNESFSYTEEYQWILKNCYKYGFIIRYPKGKEKITGYNFEPWHLRYVGIKVARIITEKNITLEEYLNSYTN